MSQLDTLYRKLISDPQFRLELLAHPEQDLQSLGIDPTPEVLAFLKNIGPAVLALEGNILGPELT
jgi:hypothetical protein